MYRFRVPPIIRPSWHLLSSNGPAEALDDAAVIVVSAESLPEIQSHINRGGSVSVGNSSLASDTVVAYGDDLGAELVVLSSAELVKDGGGHGHQRHAGVNRVGEVGAEAARSNGVQKLASRSWVAKHEDGAHRVVAGSDDVLALGTGRGRGGHGQHKGGDGE